jgi:hypothetical protein
MMKNQYRILVLAFLFFGGFLKAQTPDNWQSMGVNLHDGTNRFNGVEGFCQLTVCNGLETVLIKFVNLNTYTVKVGWKDQILTKDEQRLSGNDPQDSVTIAPGGQVVGDCSGGNPHLALKLGDFGTDAANFENVINPVFDFVIIHTHQ